MFPLALILLGLAGPDASVPAGASDEPRPGLYVERGMDGASDCDNPQAARFDLHLATGGVPPHHRSANVGEVALMIDGRRDSAVLTVTDDRWRFEGGQQHTVGVVVDGVTSGFLIGQFSLVLAPGEADDLNLVEATSSRIRRPDPDPDRQHVLVRNGETPGGRSLRPFSRCGEGRGGR